jgi:HPt (histidine-containing phosphotransfer) domain-containing protein
VSGAKHLDLEQALLWLEGDERMLERIKAIFLRNIPGQVQDLGAALQRGDLGAAERMAHTIKGSAAMMGAPIMSQQAGRIEQSAIDRDLQQARLHFATIAAEYQEVMTALMGFGERA